ncbi:MAG: glycogen synthase GlgA [bacterium]
MSLKVLYLSSEVSPFSKTGGLGDVSAALPKGLRALGYDVMVATPRYREISDSLWTLETAADNLTLDLAGVSRGFAVRRATLPNSDVPVLFIEHNEFFDRDGIYNAHGTDFPDNAERFSFFSMAALAAVKALGWKPDVVHANDWPTALAPAYLKTLLAGDPFFASAKSIYTVHNLAHQGVFPREKLPAIGLDWDLFSSDKIEFFGRINFMKAGLVYADAVTTVSPTYAKEIQTELGGFKLDGVIRGRGADVQGILNGVDYDVWSPETDRFIARRYSVREVIEGKRENQVALRNEVALAQDGTPLLGMVGRLADQKGLDIFAGAFLDLLKMDLSIIVLGEGDERYQKMLAQAVAASRGRLSVKLAFDEGLAHRIEAGADMLLMPSRYEPCGLNQLYSLRYGTVPVVRRTGGLSDSVVDARVDTLANGTATGFVFDEYSAEALLGAVRRAVTMYHDTKSWERLIRAGMAQDFSWDVSAKAYGALFQKVTGKAIAPRPAKIVAAQAAVTPVSSAPSSAAPTAALATPKPAPSPAVAAPAPKAAPSPAVTAPTPKAAPSPAVTTPAPKPTPVPAVAKAPAAAPIATPAPKPAPAPKSAPLPVAAVAKKKAAPKAAPKSSAPTDVSAAKSAKSAAARKKKTT